ncbi:uncharacterized protein LOC135351093 isoform X2 [Halichondria panicea]|uniref:uncharacterized protein LOC135351093 isoform X2 n=1 Tax=Halichondria panicea TaxID=6063 RepID=UPI00312B81D1
MQEVSQKRSAQGCIGTLGVKSILLTRLPPMVHADLRLQKSYKFSGSKRTLKRGSEPEPKAEGTLEVKATSDKTTSVVQGIKGFKMTLRRGSKPAPKAASTLGVKVWFPFV